MASQPNAPSLDMIDEPGRFSSTPATWAQHLKELETLPSHTPARQSRIDFAKRMIEASRKGQ